MMMTRRFSFILLLRLLPVALLATACEPTPPPVPGMKVGKPYSIQGKTYYPAYEPGYDKVGEASWYGPGFHGKYTASGEVFNQNDITAAHPTLPMPSMVRVTNLRNGKSVIVRINDRGPFKSNRIIDLSKKSAEMLGIKGVAQVRVQYLGEETAQYIATLKDSGQKALSMAAYQARKAEPQGQIVETLVADTQAGQTVNEAAPIQSVSSGDIGGGSKELAALAPQASEAAKEAEPLQVTAVPFNPVPGPNEKRYIRDETGKPVKLSGASDETAPKKPKPFSPIHEANAAGNEKAANAPAMAGGETLHIQVGSFSQEENARKLDSRLSGIAAVTVAKIEAAGKEWWRVRLGPFSSRPAASAALDKVRAAGIADARIIH